MKPVFTVILSRDDKTKELSVYYSDEKIDKNLLDFTTWAYIAHQMASLSPVSSTYLAIDILDFLETDDSLKLSPKLDNVFKKFYIDLHKKMFGKYFVQVDPELNMMRVATNSTKDKDIEISVRSYILNFLRFVYTGSSQSDKQRLRFYLLVYLTFYFDELLPTYITVSNNVPGKNVHFMADNAKLIQEAQKGFFDRAIGFQPGSQPYHDVINKVRNQISHYLSSLNLL